jgi:HAD superfamily hydrolase (TIGR01509 family)
MTIQALIFDFDGLIFDTETTELQAWQELFAEHGCELSLEVWANCIGRPHGFFDPYAHLEQVSGRPVDREALRLRRRQRCRELNALQKAQAGAEAYLAEAKALGLALAIASSSTHDWVAGHLERLNLLHFFDILTCAEDTARHKPDPEPYLATLKALHVPATAAIAFEDSPNGITAAKAAGLFCVAVPNPVTQRLDLSHADLMLPSLEAMPLRDLLNHLQLHP